MGVLKPLALAAAASALGGCYAPTLRDCTVSCGSPAECASGQVCGADGMCAAPDRAGHCLAEGPDAGRPDGAPPIDAAPPDTVPLVALRVRIEGKGSVVVDGRGTCSSEAPDKGDCMYDIARGVLQRARAIAIAPDQMFAGWTSATCRGGIAICAFTPAGPTAITAKFDHDGL